MQEENNICNTEKPIKLENPVKIGTKDETVFSIDTENNIIEYRAKRKILFGEELTICYNSNLKF